MRTNKLWTFFIALISSSIVVFNETADLFTKLFTPVFNFFAFMSLGIITFFMLGYLLYNWKG